MKNFNSDRDNIIVLTNTIIVILVSGFEQYCKARFEEMEKEGKNPNYEAILKEFWKSRFNEKDFRSGLTEKAGKNNISITQQLVRDSNFSFQDFQQCKKLYLKAYEIDFYNIGMTRTDIKKIKNNLGYRNRIIHVNPMISPLNEIEVKQDIGFRKEDPIFQSKNYAEQIINIFDNFICRLHYQTNNDN